MSVDPSPGPVSVLLALAASPYEQALLAALQRPGARLRVVRRCLDLADLLAVATSGSGGVAVIPWDLYRLDRDAVARLAAAGMRTFTLAPGDDGQTTRRLLALGVTAVVPVTALPDGRYDGPALAAALTAAVLDPSATDSHPGPGTGAAASQASPDGRGRVLAVWGPVGAPGRTTVAVALADELARAGSTVLLADADTYGPAVAQHLGVLDESSGLAGAVRVAAGGPLDPEALAACARSVGVRLRLLSGLTRPDRWPELRPASLAQVWRTARALADVTVVDVGFCFEDDDELAYDTAAPRRNAATVVTLDAADVVLAVGAADPVGVQRLVRGLHELRERSAEEPGPDLRVVVNRVRRGPVGARPGQRVAETLRRLAGVSHPVLVPDDGSACDLALARGRPLAKVAARSAARLALRDLALGLPAAVPA